MKDNKLLVIGAVIVGVLFFWKKPAAGPGPEPEPDPTAPTFDLGIPTGTLAQYSGSGPLWIPRIRSVIANNSNQVARHQIAVYVNYYGQPWSSELVAAERLCQGSQRDVTLNPGESYQYDFEDYNPATGVGGAVGLYKNYADFWLQDELGNRSPMVRLTSSS